MGFLYFAFGVILGVAISLSILATCSAAKIADLESEASYWRWVAEDLADCKKREDAQTLNNKK